MPVILTEEMGRLVFLCPVCHPGAKLGVGKTGREVGELEAGGVRGSGARFIEDQPLNG